MIHAALALLALTALAAIDARSAAAEIYRPWCVSYPATTTISCAFTSFEQCMMTAGPGTGGVCVQNPLVFMVRTKRPQHRRPRW
jgi:hypothetical protein